jgi:hypothetical protein
MSIDWYLLGIDTRDRLDLGKGRYEWWTGSNQDALKFSVFADLAFDTELLQVTHWISPSERHRIGGRLPEAWALRLIQRFREANPNGIIFLNVNDIFPIEEGSPFALPGEDVDSIFFLPLVAFVESDPDFEHLFRYLPELREPSVVGKIIEEMKARGQTFI